MNFADSEVVASIMNEVGIETTQHEMEADIIFINTLLFQLLLRDFLRKKEASYREENFSNDEKMKEPMSNIPCYMVEAPKLLWNWWKKERKLRLKYDEGELKVSNLFKTTTLTWLVSLYV